MNKKLLSLVIVGALAATSLPVVSVSAAEVNTSNIKSVSSITTSSVNAFLSDGYVNYGAPVYSLSGNTLSYVGQNTTTVRCARKSTSFTDANSDWYYIRCKINNGSTYAFYYVKASDVKLRS
jgi:hypothetical protein